MEHEVVQEPGREVQLHEMISHLLTALHPLASWYLLTRSSFISTDLRAQGQAVDDREIRPRGGTQKSVEGRWTHHVRCFFVPLTHRPDVCGWFGRWGWLGLRHQGGPLVSGRRVPAQRSLLWPTPLIARCRSHMVAH